MTPPLDDLLDSLHVVSLPMRVRFRGIMVREVALIDGPAGWGEFGAFLEYEPPEAAHWLAAGIEAAYEQPPDVKRDRIPINATVPAVTAVILCGMVMLYGLSGTLDLRELGTALKEIPLINPALVLGMVMLTAGFLLNNWVDTSPLPQASNARIVNAYDTLLRRARTCERLRDRLPNLVAVDFYEEGDVVGVVDELNR